MLFHGPITNLIIVAITYIFKIQLFNMLYDTIIYANLLICIFNLIPIYPLDGGRVLKYVLINKYGAGKGRVLVYKVSRILIIILTAISSILIYYFQNISILLIIGYLWIIVLRENKAIW